MGLNLSGATAIAVEIAVLHNFAWHEHVTWADVISATQRGMLRRLVRFHLANGLVSIIGNVAVTWSLVHSLRLPYLAANAVSVLLCSLLTFLLSDRVVFRQSGDTPRLRTAYPADNSCLPSVALLAVALMSLVFPPAGTIAAPLGSKALLF